MKKKWKKSIVLVLVIGMFLLLLQGCGAPKTTSEPQKGADDGAAKESKYPLKPITIIEPWGPQSWGFLQAQELAAALEPILGVRVLVEAKSGGSSAVGTKFVKDAQPDGYTLLHGWVAGLVQVPLFEENPGYDEFEDFDYLCYFTESPVVALSKADAPWNTVAEFIDYVKANPNKNYAFSGGPALSVHSIFGGQVFNENGVDVRGIFYDDAAAAGAAMLAGDVHVAFDSFSSIERYEGKVKAIGVLSNKRYAGFEDVSTLEEQGLRTPTVPSWSGMLAPKGLPDDVRNKLNDALKQVISSKEFQDNIYKKMKWYVEYKDAEQFKEYVKDSMEQMKEPIERVKAQQKK